MKDSAWEPGKLFELSASNAAGYLRDSRGTNPRSVTATPLGGGISNIVVLVETDTERFVLKQALGKLRVEQDWFSDRDRILREAAAIRFLSPLVARGFVPEILFEDRENLLFAMTAAHKDAKTWKQLLMEGKATEQTAGTIAAIQLAMIRGSRTAEFAAEFDDQTVFHQLRLDPYYRSTAARHPDLQPQFEKLIREYPGRSQSMVHGDWSPKNFLVSGESVLAIDFEVVHFGDPSFDAAFLLNHLLLKSFYYPERSAQFTGFARKFWSALVQGFPERCDAFERSTIEHLGCLMLARMDGKSPVEYITDEKLKQSVRNFARTLILHPPENLEAVFHRMPS